MFRTDILTCEINGSEVEGSALVVTVPLIPNIPASLVDAPAVGPREAAVFGKGELTLRKRKIVAVAGPPAVYIGDAPGADDAVFVRPEEVLATAGSKEKEENEGGCVSVDFLHNCLVLFL
jgi:hypothetical protein